MNEILKMYRDAIEKHPVLEKEEELELIKEIQQYDEKNKDEDAARKIKEAKDKLVLSNLRYVIKMSSKYLGLGLSQDDIIQTGIKGLLLAIPPFNPNFNVRFMTYAKLCVSREILAEIDKLPGKRKTIIKRKDKEGNIIEETANPTFISFDDLVDNADESIYVDKNAEIENLKKIINDEVNNLGTRERDVIREAFGLDDGVKKSLRTVAENLGISRGTVQLAEGRGLEKLRKDDVRKRLDGFF